MAGTFWNFHLAGELTFAENDSYFAAAEQSQAAAILVAGPFVSVSKVLIRVPNARVALARLLPVFFPPEEYPRGIHPSAVIADSASIDPTAHIGPNCVLGARVRLGARSVLMGGNDLRADCQLGDDVCLFPNVVLYRQTQLGHRVTIHAGSVTRYAPFGTLTRGGSQALLRWHDFQPGTRQNSSWIVSSRPVRSAPWTGAICHRKKLVEKADHFRLQANM